MTDSSKSFIIAIGVTITIGLARLIILPFAPAVSFILAGPASLVEGLIGRHLNHGFFLWVLEVLPQAVIIYYISYNILRRPPYWPLWIGLLLTLWFACGIMGWWQVGGGI